MFGISIPEILILLVVVLLVFGPDRLPEMARSMGKTFRTIRDYSNQFRKEFYNSVYKPVEDIKENVREQGRNLLCEDNFPVDDCPEDSSKEQEACPEDSANEKEE